MDRHSFRPLSLAPALLAFALAACSDQQLTVPGDGEFRSIVIDDPAMCGPTFATPLIAGQKYVAGSVTVSNDEQRLHVTLTTTNGWTLQLSHLAVGATRAELPVNKAGNPEPGQFAHSATHAAGTTTYTYTVPRPEVGEGAPYFVAVHADVKLGTRAEGAWGQGTPFVPKGAWAMYFTTTLNPCQGVVTGRIVDGENGAALADASVALSDNGQRVTPENGTFTFDPVHIGTYALTVSRPAFHPAAVNAVLVTTNTTTDLGDIALLPKKGLIAGRVTDQLSGAPVANAAVTISAGGVVLQTLTTGADGSYLSDSLRIGTYDVLATSPLHHPELLTDRLVKVFETTTADLALRPLLGDVTGRVVDMFNGAPLAGVNVVLSAGALSYPVTTGTDGAFEVTGVRIGSYEIAFSIADFDPRTIQPIVVAAGATVELGTIELRPFTGYLAPKVIDAQTTAPIANATVTVFAGSTAVATLTTDATGHAEVQLRIGTYTAVAAAAGFHASGPVTFIVTHAGTASTDIALQPMLGGVRGRLVDQLTGQPLGNGVVQVLSGATVLHQTTSAGDGTFTLNGIRIGSYRLKFLVPLYIEREYNNVPIVVNQLLDLHDVVMSPQQGYLWFQVRQAVTTIPIIGATIQVFRNGDLVATGTSASPYGQYEFHLRIGDYTARVSAPGYVTQDVPAQTVTYAGTTGREVFLQPANGSAQGNVVNATNGAGIAGALVEFLSGSTVVTSATTGSGGIYGPVTLAPGTYTARGTATGFTTGTQPVTVNAGATTNVGTIALSPVLPEGQVRIVLTWGAAPRDLDSHLTGPGGFHVAYYNRGTLSAYPWAYLDVDDVTGYGPETITISQQQAGTYRYSVHNYSGEYPLSASGGIVTVYRGSTQIAQFLAPQGSGSIWTVFELNGATLTSINTIGSGPYLMAEGSQAAPQHDVSLILDSVRQNPKR